ncbi:MAG: HPr family phosphocarrier protein [Lachnospiraceae bacterium]|nr:HPr family phosphocarrier protein [Lachnospiraceae bacterium]
MTQKTVTIQTAEKSSRPIAMLVQTACMFNSHIVIESGKKAINAKSLMGVMALGLQRGDTIVVTAEGLDEIEACDKVIEYLSA